MSYDTEFRKNNEYVVDFYNNMKVARLHIYPKSKAMLFNANCLLRYVEMQYFADTMKHITDFYASELYDEYDIVDFRVPKEGDIYWDVATIKCDIEEDKRPSPKFILQRQIPVKISFEVSKEKDFVTQGQYYIDKSGDIYKWYHPETSTKKYYIFTIFR